MIYCLLGENDYLARREIARLSSGEGLERFDGEEIVPEDLGRILSSQTLFSNSSQILLNQASKNKSLWAVLGAELEKLDPETLLILREIKLDKRTKTYKSLQKQAKIIDCAPLKLSQRAQAEAWLVKEASRLQLKLDVNLAKNMVARAIRPSEVDDSTIVDQMVLDLALSQLKVVQGSISAEVIDTILPPSLHENVFDLLAASLRGDSGNIRTMCAHLKVNQDGYKTLGLLASQAVTVAALTLSNGRSSDEVAADIGAHPFAVRNIAPQASGLSLVKATYVVEQLAQADEHLKQGRGEPWQLIEQSLLMIAAKK